MDGEDSEEQANEVNFFQKKRIRPKGVYDFGDEYFHQKKRRKLDTEETCELEDEQKPLNSVDENNFDSENDLGIQSSKRPTHYFRINNKDQNFFRFNENEVRKLKTDSDTSSDGNNSESSNELYPPNYLDDSDLFNDTPDDKSIDFNALVSPQKQNINNREDIEEVNDFLGGDVEKFFRRKKRPFIRIGPEYQAEIPKLRSIKPTKRMKFLFEKDRKEMEEKKKKKLKKMCFGGKEIRMIPEDETNNVAINGMIVSNDSLNDGSHSLLSNNFHDDDMFSKVNEKDLEQLDKLYNNEEKRYEKENETIGRNMSKYNKKRKKRKLLLQGRKISHLVWDCEKINTSDEHVHEIENFVAKYQKVLRAVSRRFSYTEQILNVLRRKGYDFKVSGAYIEVNKEEIVKRIQREARLFTDIRRRTHEMERNKILKNEKQELISKYLSNVTELYMSNEYSRINEDLMYEERERISGDGSVVNDINFGDERDGLKMLKGDTNDNDDIKDYFKDSNMWDNI